MKQLSVLLALVLLLLPLSGCAATAQASETRRNSVESKPAPTDPTVTEPAPTDPKQPAYEVYEIESGYEYNDWLKQPYTRLTASNLAQFCESCSLSQWGDSQVEQQISRYDDAFFSGKSVIAVHKPVAVGDSYIVRGVTYESNKVTIHADYQTLPPDCLHLAAFQMKCYFVELDTVLPEDTQIELDTQTVYRENK